MLNQSGYLGCEAVRCEAAVRLLALAFLEASRSKMTDLAIEMDTPALGAIFKITSGLHLRHGKKETADSPHKNAIVDHDDEHFTLSANVKQSLSSLPVPTLLPVLTAI